MICVMNVFRKYILSAVLLSVYALSASASSEDLAPAGITCKGPIFTKEDVIDIVKKARAANPKLAKEIENGDVNVRRQRCHYVYSETPIDNSVVHQSRTVVLNEVGEIVKFYIGRIGESGFKCPGPEYSIEHMAKFLQVSRENFTDLPKQPKEITARVNKTMCMYVYYEYPLSTMEGKGYSFTFDYNGDLYSYRPLRIQIPKSINNI